MDITAADIKEKKLSFLPFAEMALILVLTVFKCKDFYRYIGLKGYIFPVCLLSAAVLFAFFTAISLITRKDHIMPVFVLYALMSFLMLVDRMYFNYFSSLPGISKLLLVKYMVGVTDSVQSLFSIRHFLAVIDIPFFILYFLFVRRRLISRFETKKSIVRTMRALCCAGVLGCVALSLIITKTRGGYYGCYKNEIFIYHATDIFRTIVPERDGGDFNIYDYIQDKDETSKYFGAASGKNLINIQVEALNAFVIGREYNGKEITPNMNALIAENSLYFDNYYWPVLGGGGTSDAEFSVNNSLYSGTSIAAYDTYTDVDFYGLPFILKENGYDAAYAFHGYDPDFWNRRTAYPQQGFDKFICRDDFDITETIGLGISDSEFFIQSSDFLSGCKQPFYAFLITLSSHHPFNIPKEYMSLDLEERHIDTLYGNYLESVHYVDAALGEFIEALKENGLYENSVITIYGDHYGLNTKNDDGFVSELLGEEYTDEEIFKIPLIVHIPGSGIKETVETTGSHIDYEPTVLALLGLHNDKAIMFGQNLLKDGVSGHVYGQNHMCVGGFITDTLYAKKSAVGLVVYDKNTMQKLDPAQYEYISEAAEKNISDCRYALEHNLVMIKNMLK